MYFIKEDIWVSNSPVVQVDCGLILHAFNYAADLIDFRGDSALGDEVRKFTKNFKINKNKYKAI